MQDQTRNEYHAINIPASELIYVVTDMLKKQIIFKGEYKTFKCGDTGMVTLVYRHYVKVVLTRKRKPQKSVQKWHINDRLKSEMPTLAKANVNTIDGGGYAIISQSGVILTQSKTLIGLNKTVKKAVSLAREWDNARWYSIHGTDDQKAKYGKPRHTF